MGNFGVTLEERLLPSVARLNKLADSLMQSMRVALPAIVQKFTPGPPATVDVLIATNEYVMTNTGGPSGPVNLQTQAMQLPLLTGVPVQILGGGGWSLTFPIQVGDECI